MERSIARIGDTIRAAVSPTAPPALAPRPSHRGRRCYVEIAFRQEFSPQHLDVQTLRSNSPEQFSWMQYLGGGVARLGGTEAVPAASSRLRPDRSRTPSFSVDVFSSNSSVPPTTASPSTRRRMPDATTASGTETRAARPGRIRLRWTTRSTSSRML
ncbi:hypothetical protein S7711_11435 [Stachybotrys chartarum IBT 7711]|uniref:Uncharacterized protein n=1 Tax=Stachybotrys chartarum (strain CBS 109288 / IBT 7711) TaxID=1280523 RepID=A0A084B7T0_STACB|nr:hypothetical protein S7711_11435 [Stachybotrys chartarum IBT 7711]